ncbi:hypothetical protein Herbaro_01910 [Herbaspirillum sp. WKF16]|uniref:DUF769 domain-containing protein n=1 Tax=Herbaspirillum sp. WKF16 TaxID=3028312 RepID=UPI0023A99282|nr:DUF769 domain-containing protein [Herbaspirillum sp. WKF16]WDZ96562.1 hypothetical protein Herbaro_01910 [Herbaspirillum sp. WKF16]
MNALFLSCSLIFLLSACTPVGYRHFSPNQLPVSDIAMDFEQGSFRFLKQFQISHEFVKGNMYGNMGSAPISFSSCYFRKQITPPIYGDMLLNELKFDPKTGEPNPLYNKLYQETIRPANPTVIARAYLDYVSEGFKGKVNLDGYRHIDSPIFASLCAPALWGTAFVVGIRRFSVQTPERANEIRQLYKQAYSKMSWDEPKKVRRGANVWLVYKTRTPVPLFDTGEDWYLPIGDTDFYYSLQFNYKGSEAEANTPNFRKAQAAFDRIINSFAITPLK